MADEQINIDIRANDDASDKLDAVADLVAEVEEATPEIVVTADTSKAEADLKAVADEAQRVAQADARIVVEAQIDAAKGNLRELRKELDGLSGAGDSGGVAPGKALQDDLDGVADKTEKAKGAMQGFVGESVSSIPGVGAAIGPASEAVGQLTEGLLAGEVGMKGLAAAAGPIIGITLALKIVTDQLAAIDAVDAFHEEQVKEWAEAIRDAKVAVDGLRTSINDTETIDFVNTAGDTRDATDSLRELGLVSEDYVRLVALGAEGIAQYKAQFPELAGQFDSLGGSIGGAGAQFAALEFGEGKTKAYAEVLAALTQGTVDYLGAQAAAADKQAVFGDGAEAAAAKAATLATDAARAATGLGGLASKASIAAGGIDSVAASFRDLKADLADQSTYLDVVDSFDQLQTAAIDAYTAGATGAADADEKQRAYQRALIDTKGKVIEYGTEVAKLPTSVTTAITVAAGNAGADLAGLKTLLDEVERDRTTTINVRVRTPANFNGSLYAV